MRWPTTTLLLLITGCSGAAASAASSGETSANSCPQPGIANVLSGATFDRDLAGWQTVAGDGAISWTSDDAAGCPGSGSAHITLTGPTSPRLEQCAAVQPDTVYNFGVRLRAAQGGDTHCTVTIFDGASCSGDGDRKVVATWVNTAWSAIAVGGPVVTKASSRSARVSCYVDEAEAVSIDTPYLSPSPWAF